MKLNIADADTFLNDFLSPLSRISDGGVLTFDNNKISSLAATSDDTIIIFCEYQTPTPSEKISLNIPDLKKFCKLLSLVKGPLQLDIEKNSISYYSDVTRFKIHTYEDGILSIPSLNMSKLSKINFDCTFSISNEKLCNLIKGSTLTPDIKKVYLSSDKNKIYAELTDKSRDLVDNYATLIAEDYHGMAFNSISLNFEIMRLLNTSKMHQFTAKYASTLGVFNFEVKNANININYIISSLTN